MQRLVIIAVMATLVAAYRDGRRSSAAPSFDHFPPYEQNRQHSHFHEQHQPFREQSFKPQQYQSFQQRPYRQDSSYSLQSSFGEPSSLRDYSSFKSQPYYGNRPSFKDDANFKRQPSVFLDGLPMKDSRYRDQISFGNGESYQDRSRFNDQYSYEHQSFREDARPYSGSTESQWGEPYEKPMNNLKEAEQPKRQSLPFITHEDYLKYGNHGLGFASVPTIPSYENALPLNEETSTTMPSSMAPTATHKPLLESTVSPTTSAIAGAHKSATSPLKMGSMHTSMQSPTTTQNAKSNELADNPATTASTQTVSTISSAPVTAKQSSNLGQSSTDLTTTSSLPVMVTEAPIQSYRTNDLSPIQFQTTKFTTAALPSAYYIPNDLKSKLQQSVMNYFLSEQPKLVSNNNVENSVMNYVLPEIPSNSLNNKIQAPLLNYILPDDSKNALKDSVQSSLLNYLLQQGSKRALSFQRSSLPETVNYVPLTALGERPKLTMPTVPIASLSAVSRPLQTINYGQTANYGQTTLPKLSFVTSGSSASSGFPLGTALTSGLSSGISENQPASIFNSLPTGITGGISAGIPGNMSPGIPTSIPTLNFGQNFQHVGQLGQFEAPRNQPYSTGLQLQLGGFGGMDYALQSSNPAARPIELGIAKVGLSLPELSRPHVPTFAKVGFGQHLW